MIPAPRGRQPGAREPVKWLETVLQNTLLLVAVSAAPGAFATMVYAILGGFFPYLIAHVLTLQFLFTSCIVAFVFATGIGFAFGLLLGPMIVAASWSNTIQRRTSFMLPAGRWERWMWASASFAAISLTILAIAINLFIDHSHDRLWLGAYFLTAALLLGGLIILHGPRRRPDRMFILAGLSLMLGLLLVMPKSIEPLLDVIMSTIGFRSSDGEIILIDDEGYQQL